MLFEDKAGLRLQKYTTVNMTRPGDSFAFQGILFLRSAATTAIQKILTLTLTLKLKHGFQHRDIWRLCFVPMWFL